MNDIADLCPEFQITRSIVDKLQTFTHKARTRFVVRPDSKVAIPPRDSAKSDLKSMNINDKYFPY